MTSTELRKAHHTVPHALLKNFAENDKVRTRRRDGREFTQSVRAASVVRHYYSFRDADGTRDDSVEQWLASDVEDAFHAMLPTLIELREVPAGTSAVIARYVSALAVRSQAVPALIEDIDRDLGGMVLAQLLAESGGVLLDELSDEEFWHLVEELADVYDEKFKYDSRASLLRTMIAYITSLTSRLGFYEWGIHSVQEMLLIGDHPVVTPRNNGGSFGGIVPGGAPVFLPLDPHTLLVGQSPLFKPRTPSSTAMGEAVNGWTVQSCYAAVYRRPQTPWPADLELPPERPKLQRWSVTRRAASGATPQGDNSSGGLPVLADPVAQALMERLDEARRRDMEPVIERHVSAILEAMGITSGPR